MTREDAKIFLYSVAGNLGFIDSENYTCKDGEKMREAIKTLEQEPCDKCVYSTKDGYCQYDDITETIPPFEEPKTGHWIISPNDCFAHCSECGLHGDKGIYKHYGWCPKCGAKMVEPQERRANK